MLLSSDERTDVAVGYRKVFQPFMAMHTLTFASGVE
jgi:hypothetical protein